MTLAELNDLAAHLELDPDTLEIHLLDAEGTLAPAAVLFRSDLRPDDPIVGVWPKADAIILEHEAQ